MGYIYNRDTYREKVSDPMLRLGDALIKVDDIKNLKLKNRPSSTTLTFERTVIYRSVERGNCGRLRSSVVRAVDRQSKDPGSHPGTVKSVSFFPQKDS